MKTRGFAAVGHTSGISLFCRWPCLEHRGRHNSLGRRIESSLTLRSADDGRHQTRRVFSVRRVRARIFSSGAHEASPSTTARHLRAYTRNVARSPRKQPCLRFLLIVATSLKRSARNDCRNLGSDRDGTRTPPGGILVPAAATVNGLLLRKLTDISKSTCRSKSSLSQHQPC
jgi:hypothetical protein